MPQGLVPATTSEPIFCSKCRKTMAQTNFYTYKDGSKSELCKGCLTMHINNFEEETFLWLLEKFDVPYLPAEWNSLRDAAYQKDPYKMNGMSVFGKYLSKMKLNQWRDPVTKRQYGWADSEMLQEKERLKAKMYGEPDDIIAQKRAEMEERYRNGEISEAQWLTYKQVTPSEASFTVVDGAITTTKDGGICSNGFNFENVELPDLGADLTQEDKIYLAMKWGKMYTVEDWVTLEKKYKEYEESFDLHNADLLAGTLQLCKLDLKSNQALDSGDYDAYSKLSRAYDTLRKSLKFTEAQRKEDKSSEFSCYGQIVAFAEKYNDEDYIRPIDLSVDRDIVDADLHNIKSFTKQLIDDDPAVFKLIEQYIKKREILAEQEADAANADENGYEITDEDLSNFTNAIEQQRKEDLKLLNFDEEDDDE